MSYKSYPEYKAYQNMLNNCLYTKEYNTYAEGNIQIYTLWLPPGGFKRFLEDIGTKPSPKHKLCRKDLKNDYSPENCYWGLTSKRKDSVLVTYNKQTKTLVELCKELGLEYKKVYGYLHRNKYKKTQQEIIEEILKK